MNGAGAGARRAARASRGARTAWLALALLAGALLAGGCAGPAGEGPPRATPAVPAPGEAGTPRWWTVRFFVAWDRARAPEWHVDTLLADRVVAPLVAALGTDAPLWRVHRRAAPDEAGHRFSLYFLAGETSARRARAALAADPLLGALLADGTLARVVPPDLAAPGPSEPGATSDPAWPAEIRRAWPWYIMGVSRAWLALVREAAAADPAPPGASAAALAEHYRRIEERVSALWRDTGQHAYLHHLSGVFGYRPLLLRDPLLWQF